MADLKEVAMIITLIGLALINLVLLIILLNRGNGDRAEEYRLKFDLLDKGLEKVEHSMREEFTKNREEGSNSSRLMRDELSASLKSFSETSSSQIMGLTQLNEQKLEGLKKTVEDRLKAIQDDNSQKLEQMRATVDEKLHDTLEKRLGESFNLVCDRLDKVREGLGEMQTLASGVGDLKKVLTNIKVRGTMGEVQLGTLLDQLLTPEQYAKNVVTKEHSRENVEFALKLPGKDDKVVWLPIDSKFPLEDYQRLIEAQEQANPVLVEEIGRALENRIKSEAKAINEKYLNPPHTTDFGILFLPIEGLYAEVLRRPGLFELLQREYRVIMAGPTTIAALLNCLQLGFRTLAIEKRASEVWNLLGAVKTEFGKFGNILERSMKHIEAVSNTIEAAAKKSKTIERRLREVQALPGSETTKMLDIREDSLAEGPLEDKKPIVDSDDLPF
ncbi:MAG: DNA recombination protein RmuC [Candidatus Omnitrophota bacterium]